jgi:hypothetical protein
MDRGKKFFKNMKIVKGKEVEMRKGRFKMFENRFCAEELRPQDGLPATYDNSNKFEIQTSYEYECL